MKFICALGLLITLASAAKFRKLYQLLFYGKLALCSRVSQQNSNEESSKCEYFGAALSFVSQRNVTNNEDFNLKTFVNPFKNLSHEYWENVLKLHNDKIFQCRKSGNIQ